MHDYELELEKSVPAIYSTDKYEKRTAAYELISTAEILDTFKESNWHVQTASQRKRHAKNANLNNFSKHLVTFQNPDLPEVNGISPQINLINSHDGTCPFTMMAGLYRFICENGLIVADSEFEAIKIRHIHLNPARITESISRIVDIVPAIIGKADEMQSIVLNAIDRIQYAKNVIKKIWKDPKVRPFEPIQLLETRRDDDKPTNIWNTYNAVQENLVKGGLIGITTNNKKRKMRGITNIEKNVSTNQILWQEADKMLQAA